MANLSQSALLRQQQSALPLQSSLCHQHFRLLCYRHADTCLNLRWINVKFTRLQPLHLQQLFAVQNNRHQQ